MIDDLILDPNVATLVEFVTGLGLLGILIQISSK